VSDTVNDVIASASEMTYIVSGGALNSTQYSLTHSGFSSL